jgi:hypothetical protein
VAVYLISMPRFDLGYGGKWRERFDDEGAAIARAEELAAGGETVEVAKRLFGLHAFLTAFPESEREALRDRRGYPYVGDLWGFGVSGEAHHHQGGAPGDHAGGGSHGHGGGQAGHGGHGGH